MKRCNSLLCFFHTGKVRIQANHFFAARTKFTDEQSIATAHIKYSVLLLYVFQNPVMISHIMIPIII